MEALAIVMVLALGFVVAGLRKRIGTLENIAMRLQDRIEDLSRRSVSAPSDATIATAAPADAAPAPAPIDIEPFVD